MKRLRNIRHKKRLVLAVAAVIYRRTGSYAKTYETLNLCLTPLMQNRITENWIRTKLKRLGIGFSKRHYGETYECDGWVVSRLNQVTYGAYGETTIYSHHHKGGSAFEVVEKCPQCGEGIPANLLAYDKLLRLRKKVT